MIEFYCHATTPRPEGGWYACERDSRHVESEGEDHETYDRDGTIRHTWPVTDDD